MVEISPDIRQSLFAARGKLVLGVDPGDLTGIAVLERDGTTVYIGNIKAEDIPDFLTTNEIYLGKLISHVVMEDYLLYEHKARQQTGSRFKAVQVIGQVKMWAKMKNIPIITQQARILTIAEKWSGIKPKGKHQDTHFVDAYNHAFYWLVNQGMAKTKLERSMENGKEKQG